MMGLVTKETVVSGVGLGGGGGGGEESGVGSGGDVVKHKSLVCKTYQT